MYRYKKSQKYEKSVVLAVEPFTDKNIINELENVYFG
jgi:hypothetical protein